MVTILRASTRKKSPYLAAFFILFSVFILSSCARTSSELAYKDGALIYDPFEKQNRQVMAFNQAVDRTIINPVVKGYRVVAPSPIRRGVRNFLRNLKSPVIFTNQLLQGDFPGARDAFLRAAINSSVGVGGIFDVAGYEGIEYEPEDFGQTLAVWGVDYGPYMVVPLIGPSSLRDYGGYFADSFADPLRWYLFNIEEEHLYYTKSGIDYLDLRESLMDTLTELEQSSFDYYAAVRSTYYQHRDALIRDQNVSREYALPIIPNYEDE